MKSSLFAVILLAAACSAGAPASPSPVPPTAGTPAPSSAPTATVASAASPAPTATAGSTAGYTCDPDMSYGCDASPSAGTPAPAGEMVVITQSASASPHLLGPNGNALYTFDNDTATSSACETGCTDNWPPIVVQPGYTVQAGGHEEDFSTITRSDGSLQLTYYGKPLYNYAGDASATDANGDGLFGKWHLAVVESM
jgi:predicted lipoprotein with Yx(FWY)xxD motif